MKETIIQFGEGNFLRGFVDYFIHTLNEKNIYNGKVVVVQPIENGLSDLINEQNGEYNLYLRGIENKKEVCHHTKVTSISRALNPYDNYEEYLKLAHNPDIRFVISNTTEAGIAFDDTCCFSDKPAASFPAKVTRLLWERFKRRLSGFVFLPCELIDNNADELRRRVLQYARYWDLGDDFINWINTENKFCNTLVDRIVTGYPKEEAETICNQLGYKDELIDTAEVFHLWVIEGDYESELPLQKAGFNVIWTNDVSPYKKRKVRVLNGAHTAMVCAALLAGKETVKDCLDDEVIEKFLKKCLFKEILPVLGETNENIAFANSVLERFANPFIKHRLSDIVLNSVSKFSVRVLPSIFDYYEVEKVYPKSLVFSLSALILFYQQGLPKDDFQIIQFIRHNSIHEVLSNQELWGTDLSGLTEMVESGIEQINENGIKEAMLWSL